MTERLAHILSVLRAHEGELRRRGIVHAAVFGSVARGDDRPDSDIDLLVEVDPATKLDLLQWAEIVGDLQDWTGKTVDLAERTRLKKYVRPSAEREAVHAF